MQTVVQRAAAVLGNGLQRLHSQAHCFSLSAAFSSTAAQPIRWVFLGPPGVGKGTYASRIAQALGVPHIAAGDLVRAEIKSGSALGQQVSSAGATTHTHASSEASR
jgi:adenylate kinase